MKKVILAAFLLVIGSQAFAQQDVDLQNVQLNGNFIAPGFTLEKRLSPKQSIVLGVGAFPVFDEKKTQTIVGETEYDSGVSPFINASFRNYYSRKRVNKELRHNSGNFFGGFAEYNFDVLGTERDDFNGDQVSNTYSVGAIWGFQRNYKSGIHLGISIGLGIVGGENRDIDLDIPGAIEFGFVLAPRKEIKAKKL